MSTIPFHSKKLMAASSAQKEEKSLNGAEGGPPMDTVDSRLAKVEAKVDIIMSEISGWRRWMIGTAIAIFFGFLGVLLRMDSKFDAFDARMDRIEAELRTYQEKHDAEWKDMLRELTSQDKRLHTIETKK